MRTGASTTSTIMSSGGRVVTGVHNKYDNHN